MAAYHYCNKMGQSHDKLKRFKMINVICCSWFFLPDRSSFNKKVPSGDGFIKVIE